MGKGAHPHGPGQHHGQNHANRHSQQHSHPSDNPGQTLQGGGTDNAPSRDPAGDTEALKQRLARIRAALKQAQKAGNSKRVAELRAERDDIKRKLKKLGTDPGQDDDTDKGDGTTVPDPEPDPSPGDEGEDPLGPGNEPDSEDFDDDSAENAATEAAAKEDIRTQFRTFLAAWGLPDTLMGFVEDALVQGMAFAEIQQKLFLTPEYLTVFPEGELRRQAGLSWWSASTIRDYRETARQVLKNELGIANVTDSEIAGLITQDVSLPEWESRLQTWKQYERWGPTVRAVLESELGLRITDDRVFAFMNKDIPTPDLDRAYERALMRGQPALLGLGVRPEEEAELLRRYGISPEQAFRGYQGIVQDLPAQERFGFIEGEINRNSEQFPNGSQLFNDTPFALLFRGIQLQEGDALRELQARLARETARFQAGGGAAQQGTALTGLQGTAGPT